MYQLEEKHIDFILEDLAQQGINSPSLQADLCDHICCMIEAEMPADADFKEFYYSIIHKFYKSELKEIQTETNLLLTFKNYYQMKKIMIISGVTACIGLLLGTLAKIFHLPGALFFYVSAVVLVTCLFLPLLFLIKQSELKNTQQKLVWGAGIVLGILYSVACIATILRLPLAHSGVFWISTFAFALLVFVPLYFFNGIKDTNAKWNTVLISCLLFIFFTLQFMLVNLRPA